jgi:inner membrane protein
LDSLTQAVLGATVGVAVAGRRIGARKAAVLGAVLGTLPDLDVFISHGDPVSNYIMHRGPTHSLVVQALVTPLMAEPLRRLLEELRTHRAIAYALVFLSLSTHALLDAMTIYGTKLLWPLTDHPFGVGSMFIIDPLYTLPLLVVALWALFRAELNPRLKKATVVALTVSTLYLGWSAAAQSVITDRAKEVLEARGLAAERLFATPTAFNTLFWRAVALDGDRYLNLYVPVFGSDREVTVHAHDRGTGLPVCLDTLKTAGRVNDFAGGFVRFNQVGDDLLVGDLRMGLEPGFVFDFAVARWDGRVFEPIEPRRVRSPRMAEGDLEWLLAGLRGAPTVRLAEQGNLLPDAATQVAAAGADKSAC